MSLTVEARVGKKYAIYPLTLDNELKEFIRERGLKDNLLSPDQIAPSQNDQS